MNDHHIAKMDRDSRWIMAVTSADQAVWDHDFEKNEHYLSDTWRTLRGLTIDDEIPLTTEEWFKTIHEGDIAHLAEEWQRINRGVTDIINYKFRQRHKNGHWVWFLSRGRVIRRDATGRPARIAGTDTDISDIKAAAFETERMAQRLAVAMEAARMGRWELDLETGEAYWDDHLLQILGLTGGRNYRPGNDWHQFIHPDDREEVVQYLDGRCENRLNIERDYRILNAKGETLHIRALGKFADHPEMGPRFYGVNFDITRDKLQAAELENARALLEYESRHDALTKLANRRKLDEAFSEHVKKSTNGVSVLHIDIDHFKHINDTLGHDAGDATLKHAAHVLQNCVSGISLVSRVGGDEFVALVFKVLGKQELQSIAEAIIRQMSQPFYYGSHMCAFGTSIGIATSDDCKTVGSSVFINADLALYEAKKAGRGRYRFYTPSMKDEVRSRKRTYDALSAGLERGEITCHYQPQYDAVTLEPTGLEALVRWESPTFGLIMPDQFLGVAEDMGILAKVDGLVLLRVLDDIEKWQSIGSKVLPISVNVSASRLNDPTFADQLRELDIPQGTLSFELLESAFLDTTNQMVCKNLMAVRELGISVEIDDFGSGHASIASLLAVSPTRLKIDRALVSPITTSECQRELVKNMIGIGHMLGIKVVAEGVETAAHVEVLQSLRCDFLQGFGLSRPLDFDKTCTFLAACDGARLARKLA